MRLHQAVALLCALLGLAATQATSYPGALVPKNYLEVSWDYLTFCFAQASIYPLSTLPWLYLVLSDSSPDLLHSLVPTADFPSLRLRPQPVSFTLLRGPFLHKHGHSYWHKVLPHSRPSQDLRPQVTLLQGRL
jgi:hypothetical protein